MSKKEMKIQIVDDLYNREEILSMLFTDININRWLRLGDLEEIDIGKYRHKGDLLIK